MNMPSMLIRGGNCCVSGLPSKTRKLIRLYSYRLTANLVKKAVKKALKLDETVLIAQGFYCESPRLVVGSNTSLNDLYIHGLGDVVIGKNVSISRNCEIISGTHNPSDFNKIIYKPIFIEDFSWIASGVRILDGLTIGRGAIIGACSVVRTSIPPYAIVFGNPCKVIGFRYTPEEALEFEKEHFTTSDRIPLEKLQRNYERYYLKRFREIKSFAEI